MGKNIKEGRTMAIVLDELNDSVDKYNDSNDSNERVKLIVEHKKLVEEYNTISLLTAYAEFIKSDKPLVELAKAYYYGTISTKDTPHNEVVNGVQTSTITRSVVTKDTKLNVSKFIEWTEEKNKGVAASKDWKAKTEAARVVVEEEWRKFFAADGDTHAVNISATKKAIQSMFDSLVFIKAENSDKNAIIANGNIAKWVFAFANARKDSKVDGKVNITGQVLGKSAWNVMQLDILHKAVTGKDFDIVYGDPEEEAVENSESEEATEAK